MHTYRSLKKASAKLDFNERFWNIAFTGMLRQTERGSWGNWSLNPAVRPGALGILNYETGTFSYVASIIDPKIVTMSAPHDWSMESSSVRRTETKVDFKGGYLDPSTGTEVNVGIETAWKFDHEGSIVSRGTISGSQVVDDYGTLLEKQFGYVLEKAKSVGKATGDGITQGFGMITSVTQCLGALNIGSLKDASTFSITGSIDGVNSMAGTGDASAALKGSYKDIREEGAFESRKFPSEANKAASGEVAIAYEFASFDGKLIIPQWVSPLSAFRITFDNAHGGTYIVDCKVTYDTPQQKGVEKTISVWGGQSHSIDGIPLDATNVKINMHFKGGDDFFLSDSRPLTNWFMGQRTIDLYGVWPWSCSAEWRAE